MVGVLAPSAVDRGSERQSVQTKDYNLAICYFSVRHTALMSKYKYQMARNHDNVSQWSDMSVGGTAVDRGSERQSVQTKDYNIDICYFSIRHTALRSNYKYQMARNHDNVSQWSDMSVRGTVVSVSQHNKNL